MLFHASIPAEHPERAAAIIAELWQGFYGPFPPFPKSFIAIAGDARGTEIEVVPRSQENRIGEVEVVPGYNEQADGHSACHLAIATPLSEAEVLSIAEREGWHARVCDRGGCFHVIEFWLENRFLLEVLTESMQREYLAFLTPDSWQRTFGELCQSPRKVA